MASFVPQAPRATLLVALCALLCGLPSRAWSQTETPAPSAEPTPAPTAFPDEGFDFTGDDEALELGLEAEKLEGTPLDPTPSPTARPAATSPPSPTAIPEVQDLPPPPTAPPRGLIPRDQLPPPPKPFGARHWLDISNFLREAWTNVVAVDPKDPMKAYIATWDGFFYRTDDGGETWEEIRLLTNIPTYYGQVSSKAGESNLGLGLSAGAPRLRALTRAFISGKFYGMKIGLKVPPNMQRLVGVNIKQLLVTRGTRPKGIRHIEISPHDSNLIYVGTEYGLHRSQDAGITWSMVFIGQQLKERDVQTVRVHPTIPNRVYIGTKLGPFISDDYGASWRKIETNFISELRVNWFVHNPHNPDMMVSATSFGVFRSEDGGENWDWVDLASIGNANWVRSADWSTQRPNEVFISTGDGLFRSVDQGKSFQRWGSAYLSRGRYSYRVMVNPKDADHVYAVTDYSLWETRDGVRWNAIYERSSRMRVSWVDCHPDYFDEPWLLTEQEIFRMVQGAASAPPLESRDESWKQNEPPLDLVLDAGFRYGNLGERELWNERKFQWWHYLVPQVTTVFQYWRTTWEGTNDVSSVLDAQGRNRVPFRVNTGNFEEDQWALGFWFTFPYFDEILFNYPQDVPFGRIFDLNRRVRGYIERKLFRMYIERRRHMERLRYDTPDDPVLEAMLRLRVDELTSHMDILTGGFMKRYLRTGQPDGPPPFYYPDMDD